MTHKNIDDVLHTYKYKSTAARRAILGVFTDMCKPMSALDVFTKVKKEKVDLATVYRSLGLFTKSGILKEVTLQNDAVRYELAGDDHHHIVCVRCKKVEEFDGCDSHELVSNALKKAKGFASISHHAFDLFGVCKRCVGK